MTNKCWFSASHKILKPKGWQLFPNQHGIILRKTWIFFALHIIHARYSLGTRMANQRCCLHHTDLLCYSSDISVRKTVLRLKCGSKWPGECLVLWSTKSSILRSSETTQLGPGHFNNALIHFNCHGLFLRQCVGCRKHDSSSITPISCIRLSTLPYLFRVLRYLDPESTVQIRCSLLCMHLMQLSLTSVHKCVQLISMRARRAQSALGRSRNRRLVVAHYPGIRRPGRKAATHLHLVPSLRMCGAIPVLPPYAFTACTGTSPTTHEFFEGLWGIW